MIGEGGVSAQVFGWSVCDRIAPSPSLNGTRTTGPENSFEVIKLSHKLAVWRLDCSVWGRDLGA